MKKKLMGLILIVFTSALLGSMNLKGQGKPSIFKILNEYVCSSGNRDAGIIAGCIDCKSGKIDIFSQGAIDKNNDLKLVCPASKPAITYLILKNNIDPERKIDQWFPLDQGYTKSDRIQ
jgi:hypothetical protein